MVDTLAVHVQKALDEFALLRTTEDDPPPLHFYEPLDGHTGDDHELPWASFVGRCPARQAFMRQEVPASHPGRLPENARRLQHLFETGHLAEQWAANALEFGARDRPWQFVLCEYSLDRFPGGPGLIAGRVDIALKNYNGGVVGLVEVKDAGQMRPHYIAQAWAYYCETGCPVVLALHKRDGWTVYDMQVEDGEVRVWPGQALDQALAIPVTDLEQAVDRCRRWLSCEPGVMLPPYGVEPVVATGDGAKVAAASWECGRVAQQPRRYSPKGRGSVDGRYQPGDWKPGQFTARCPWFGLCYGHAEYKFEIVAGDGKPVLCPAL